VRLHFAIFITKVKSAKSVEFIHKYSFRKGDHMRICDHRYIRDLRRYNLAYRLLVLGARAQTIARWTRLSKYQVRTLHRSYAPELTGSRGRRGASPSRLEFFSRNQQLKWEAGVFGSMCQLQQVLPAASVTDPKRLLPSIERGERLCEILEEYSQILSRDYELKSQITIEHAILLLNALAAAEEMRLRTCSSCGGVIAVDLAAQASRCCIYCEETHRVRVSGATRLAG
jgi:hypothetical protein